MVVLLCCRVDDLVEGGNAVRARPVVEDRRDHLPHVGVAEVRLDPQDDLGRRRFVRQRFGYRTRRTVIVFAFSSRTMQ